VWASTCPTKDSLLLGTDNGATVYEKYQDTYLLKRTLCLYTCIHAITQNSHSIFLAGQSNFEKSTGFVIRYDKNTWQKMYQTNTAFHECCSLQANDHNDVLIIGKNNGSVSLQDIRSTVIIQQSLPISDSQNDHNVWSIVENKNQSYFYTGHEDGTIRMFDIRNIQSPVQSVKKHTDRIHSLFYTSSTGELITSSLDGTIRFWNPKNLKNTTTITTDPMYCAAYRDDKKEIAVGYATNPSIDIFDLARKQVINTIRQNGLYQRHISYISPYSLLSSMHGNYDSVKIFDTQKSNLEQPSPHDFCTLY
jgi:WD40 repeat protein